MQVQAFKQGFIPIGVYEADFEEWLHAKALPTFDALAKDPASAMSADASWAIIQQHIAKASERQDKA